MKEEAMVDHLLRLPRKDTVKNHASPSTLRLALDQAKGGKLIGTEIKEVSASMVAATEWW